jgi:hypothetical protein
MAGKGGSLPKHGEKKKQRSIYLTDNAWHNLDNISDGFMLTKSELIEMVGQGRLKVVFAEEVNVNCLQPHSAIAQ